MNKIKELCRLQPSEQVIIMSEDVKSACKNIRFPRHTDFWDLGASVFQSHTMTLKHTTKNVLTTIPRYKMDT